MFPHQLTNTKAYILYNIRKQFENANMGQILWSKIGREAKWLPTSMKQIYQANLLLTLKCAITPPVQEYDQDMADSNSPLNNKKKPITHTTT